MCMGHDPGIDGQGSRLGYQFEMQLVGPQFLIEDSFVVDNYVAQLYKKKFH